MKSDAIAGAAHQGRGLVVHLFPALLCLALGVCLSARGGGGTEQERKVGTDKAAQQTWGIHIEGVRLSAAGFMVDFRYKVLDPDKAAPLADRKTKPFIIDQATKAKLLVPTTPKVGSVRQTATKLIPGRIYGAMFANPAQVVKAGSKVTVVIGDFRAENLTVQ